jgi:hypothetical protein
VRDLDLLKNFPDYTFVAGRFFMWSPRSATITYDPKRLKTNSGKIGLLHEIGHATLGHVRYPKYDMELLGMEMDAWDFVRQHAASYGLNIDEAHIKRCIASYDYWLSKRATCPDCNNFSLQKDRSNFACFICGAGWRVNNDMLRRVKRTVTNRWEHTSYQPH